MGWLWTMTAKGVRAIPTKNVWWVYLRWENLFVWVVVLWENILAWVVVLSVNDK